MIASPYQWCMQANNAQDWCAGVLVFGLMIRINFSAGQAKGISAGDDFDQGLMGVVTA